MDSDRRSSGELVIDEDAIIGSPRSEASESTITRNRNVESVLMNNNHTEPDTSITNFAQPKGMKRKRSPATKRTTARAKKAAAETNSKNKRVANTQVTNQLTKKMHYFKLNTLKDLKTTSLSVSFFLNCKKIPFSNQVKILSTGVGKITSILQYAIKSAAPQHFRCRSNYGISNGSADGRNFIKSSFKLARHRSDTVST